MKKNAGFTLIELVAVMVILAILAVIAVPQFVDLRVQARQAATEGVAGALSSASALNYATRVATSGASGTAVNNCSQLPTLLAGGALPQEGGQPYTIAAGALAAGTGGSCTLSYPGGSPSVSFSAIGAD